MVRVSVTASIPDLSKAVRREGAKAIERRANRYGQQMVALIPTVLQARGVQLNRPENRRRSPGSTRIQDGWSHKVEGDPGSFPILLTLTSSGDAAQLERIELIDKGTPGHQIRAAQKRSPGGQFGGRGYLRFPPEGVNGPPWVYAQKVSHPGSSKGKGFIRAVMEQVIGTARGRF